MLRASLVLALVGCTSNVRATDPDHDGVANDRCPNDAEDFDAFQDSDGCPDLDNDLDRLADLDDQCALEPEDRDSFEDEDGCPDPDNDEDRIADANDACPDEPEVYNGFLDDDGCPDPIVIDYESFTDNLFIPVPILFTRGDATIADESYVKSFARWLASEPKVELLGVIGHIEPGEPALLGLTRARVVANTLVAAGVAPSRLSIHDAATAPAREWAHVKRPDGADRSVHFRYFRIAGKTINHWNGSLDVHASP